MTASLPGEGAVGAAAEADLSLVKVAAPDPVAVGQSLVWTLTVSNAGPDAAANVVVTDLLPASVTFVSASSGCSEALGTVTCALGSLGSGASAEATVTVTPNVVGPLTNTAQVSSDTGDPVGGNNSGEVTSQVVAAASADLSLVKVAAPDPVAVGQSLTWTLTVSNAGPDGAAGVVVTDQLPGSVTFVSAGSGCDEVSGTVTCTLGTIADGANKQRTITVTPNSAGPLSNTAEVSSDTGDPASGNNSGSVTVQVNPIPTLPNIVVVMADDQPPLDGRLVDHMPNVQSIFAQHGVTFTDFHSESPLCCPARAGFLTGQHTHNHHVVTNAARQFDPSETIVTELAGLGYQTMLAGKYMNQYAKNCKKPINCAPTIPAGWDNWAAFGEPNYYKYDLWVGNKPGPATVVHYGTTPAEYSTDVVAQKAVDMINAAPLSRPIFAWITPYGTHAPSTPAPRHAKTPCTIQPWTPPNWNEADVSDKPLYVQQTALLRKPSSLVRACRTLRSVDDLVGRVRDALASSGRLNDTIFIYSGDNGMNVGAHRLDDKSAPYETRIPFYASWPKELGSQPGSISERVQNIDLAPTLCDIVGCNLGPYPNGQTTPDGHSFASLLLNQATALSRDAVLDEMPQGWHQPGWYSVTTTGASSLAMEGCAAAVTGGCRWHYIEYPSTGEKELYDVSNGPCWLWTVGDPGDPCELQNVVSDVALTAISLQLKDRLTVLRNEKGSP